MHFLEKERQEEQRKMFEIDAEGRRRTYRTIYQNLRATRLANGASYESAPAYVKIFACFELVDRTQLDQPFATTHMLVKLLKSS